MAAPAAAPGSTPGSSWRCRLCTYSNPQPLGLVCEVCSSPRQPASSLGTPPGKRRRRGNYEHRAATTSTPNFHSDAAMAARSHADERAGAGLASSDAAMAARLLAHEEREAAAPSSPAMLAAGLCEELRRAADKKALPHGSTVNHDLALAFLQRHHGALGASPKNEVEMLVVHHGTKPENYRKIINSNLRVPDGVNVLHATDNGFHGKGVCTAPDPATALAYAAVGGGAKAPVFVCLALPGRQFAATMPRDQGKPIYDGYDSNYSPGGAELVFGSSDQLLPVFLADVAHIAAAAAAAREAITFIAANTGNTNPVGPPAPGRRQSMPTPHGAAALPAALAAVVGLGLGLPPPQGSAAAALPFTPSAPAAPPSATLGFPSFTGKGNRLGSG